jgi:hypothetical protein
MEKVGYPEYSFSAALAVTTPNPEKVKTKINETISARFMDLLSFMSSSFGKTDLWD